MRISEKKYNAMPSELQRLFIKLPNPEAEEVLAGFPNTKTGDIKSGTYHNRAKFRNVAYGEYNGNETYDPTHSGDSGTAARFFYCAKASRAERGENNGHPTVKPLALMRYLIKLITPPNGIILDPFMGSGSTLVAAKQLGFKAIGIEMEENYCEIAKKRCSQMVLPMEVK